MMTKLNSLFFGLQPVSIVGYLTSLYTTIASFKYICVDMTYIIIFWPPFFRFQFHKSICLGHINVYNIYKIYNIIIKYIYVYTIHRAYWISWSFAARCGAGKVVLHNFQTPPLTGSDGASKHHNFMLKRGLFCALLKQLIETQVTTYHDHVQC